MDRDEDRTRSPAGGQRLAVVPVGSGGVGRRVVVLVAVCGLVLSVAILKPWAETSPPSGPTSPPSAEVSARPRPTTDAVAPAPAPSGQQSRRLGLSDPGGQCSVGSAWRVFAVEQHYGRRVLTWYSVDPVPVADPRDPAIPEVRVVAGAVLALGFCAAVPEGASGPAAVHAWTTSLPGDAVPLDLRALTAYAPPDPRLGAVYDEAGGAVAGGGWPPGTYVFAVRSGRTTGESRWFAVRIAAEAAMPQSTSAST